MKPRLRLVYASLAVLLIVPSALRGFDSSPNHDIIIPECIWAAATGGGTWVTEVQVTAYHNGGGDTTVQATFYYGTGSRTVTLGSLYPFHSFKYSNVLQAMQTLDPGFSYYGRVGALWLVASGGKKLYAQARTYNGNYGKTCQGVPWVDGNTANYGPDTLTERAFAIQNLTQDATYRTFIGCFNAISGGYGMTVEFLLVDDTNTPIGSAITKTIPAWNFVSFNPFAEAGVGSGTYTNAWVWIHVTTSGSYGADSRGLIAFASSANNYTNDTYAHVAVQFN